MLKPGFYWGWLGMCFIWALIISLFFYILKQILFEEEEAWLLDRTLYDVDVSIHTHTYEYISKGHPRLHPSYSSSEWLSSSNFFQPNGIKTIRGRRMQQPKAGYSHPTIRVWDAPDMAFPPTSLINSKIDSALFFHKKYKKFGTKMIAIMRRIMPEIHPSSFSAMAISERAPSKTCPASSLAKLMDSNTTVTLLRICQYGYLP